MQPEGLTGCPRQTGQTWVLGGAPYSFLHLQKAFVLVLSCIWHSMPMTASYPACRKKVEVSIPHTRRGEDTAQYAKVSYLLISSFLTRLFCYSCCCCEEWSSGTPCRRSVLNKIAPVDQVSTEPQPPRLTKDVTIVLHGPTN